MGDERERAFPHPSSLIPRPWLLIYVEQGTDPGLSTPAVGESRPSTAVTTPYDSARDASSSACAVSPSTIGRCAATPSMASMATVTAGTSQRMS